MANVYRLVVLFACLSCSAPSAPGTTPIAIPIVLAKPCPVCPARDAGADASIDAAIAIVNDANVDAAVAMDASVVQTMHPRIMLPSQSVRLRAALVTPAGVRWRGTVDRWVAGADLWGFDAWNAALLGALTSAPQYCVKAVTTIDAQVSAAEIKIASGAAPLVAGDSYLGVGEMIGDLALVYDWCATAITSGQRARWIAYANQAVSNVWNHATASWGGRSISWTGWATDDPSDNYYYSFLRATMLLGLATQGENARATEWLAKFKERLVGRLVPEFATDLLGGGSREGTGYGVALRNLFELYAFWQWTTGERLADLTTHARETVLTVMQQILPGGAWKAPTGDQSRDSTAALFDYDRSELLELAALYPDEHAPQCAVSLLGASSVPVMRQSFMLGYDVVFQPTGAVPNDTPLVRRAEGIGQLYARTSWANGATWFNLIAGAFTQSHAHEDQGSLMLWRDGWLATDAVIWSKGGVRQSSSLVGTTAAHSLVRIDFAGAPVPQREGTVSKLDVLSVGDGYVFASADLTPAYGGNAMVKLVRRQVLWLQPDVFVIQDHVVTDATTSQTWQLVLPVAPAITATDAVAVIGAHSMRVSRIAPVIGVWSTYDFRLIADFTAGWRLDQTQPGGDRTYVTVIAIDSASIAAAKLVQFSSAGVTFDLGGKHNVIGAPL